MKPGQQAHTLTLPCLSQIYSSLTSPMTLAFTEWASGHITEVHDPLRSVSVLEPGGPGGCGLSRRELVEHTAKTRKCLVSQNGGFFDIEQRAVFGECHKWWETGEEQWRNSKCSVWHPKEWNASVWVRTQPEFSLSTVFLLACVMFCKTTGVVFVWRPRKQ